MKVDMSPQAVTTRLRRASQLRRLCLSLGKAQPVGSGRSQEVAKVNVDPDLEDVGTAMDRTESG